jgi:hypothetical protein
MISSFHASLFFLNNFMLHWEKARKVWHGVLFFHQTDITHTLKKEGSHCCGPWAMARLTFSSAGQDRADACWWESTPDDPADACCPVLPARRCVLTERDSVPAATSSLPHMFRNDPVE